MLPPHQTLFLHLLTTLEEELAQVQRRLEEKEAEVANLRARMVGMNNQGQQVAGQSSTSGWSGPNKNNLYHFFESE